MVFVFLSKIQIFFFILGYRRLLLLNLNLMNFDVTERSRQEQEQAILVGVIRPHEKSYYDEPLTELANLAKTAGVEVLARLVQKRTRFHPGTYIGKGKVEELKMVASELAATIIIFDDSLSPGQARNLEKIVGVRIIDRTELILDIFAMHAQTREAKLQVELAQLEYVLPRLQRMWAHLDSQQGGLGFRGPGEKQLETDRQIIKKRIADSKRDLLEIQRRKEREVFSRKKRFTTIGLVGYTNAGKSSLMNKLTSSDVLVEDKLFATLDTKTCLWDIAQGRKVLLSDTVGFINKLPHNLIASFRATLEEARQADILLHVVDVSDQDAEHHIEVVKRVLSNIGLQELPNLLVFNKMDLWKDPADFSHLQAQYPEHVCISAKNGHNIDLLKSQVLEMIEASMWEIDAFLPAENGKLLSWMVEYGRVIEKKIVENRIQFRVCLAEKNVRWLQKQEGVEVITEESVVSL